MARNILVVEDDNNISNLIKMYLDKEGFDVRIAADGGKAVEEFKEKEPDLVLLDVMLPVLDGWGVCAKIRETSKCPIIMLTAKGEVNDRIHGLEMGADDYVVKPFEMKELLARINAVLRRSEIPEDTHKRLTFDKLIIDLDSYELIVDGKKIDTPPKELELLYHLAPQPLVRRQQGIAAVVAHQKFGVGHGATQTDEALEVFILRLAAGLQVVHGHLSNETGPLLQLVPPLGEVIVIAQGEKGHAQQQQRQHHHAGGQGELLPVEPAEPFLALCHHFTSNL